MATLFRILKHTPAVIIGLLVAAWVVSVFSYASILLPRVAGWHILMSSNRSSVLVRCTTKELLTRSGVHYTGDLQQRLEFAGGLAIASKASGADVAIPYPLIITTVLPLAIGSFISLRFRLWHYLAYTSLLAVELAYYLRW